MGRKKIKIKFFYQIALVDTETRMELFTELRKNIFARKNCFQKKKKCVHTIIIGFVDFFPCP